MYSLADAYIASQYSPDFWNIMIYPLLPVGLFLFATWYLIRDGAKPARSRWLSAALMAFCAYSPAFALLSLRSFAGAQTEVLSQVMAAMNVQRAYETYCEFADAHRSPEDVDWATNVLRDHVLWVPRDKPLEQKALPANEPISCERIPVADTHESRERYANLASLLRFMLGGFLICTFAAIWGCWFHLLPKRDERYGKGAQSVAAGRSGDAPL